MIVLDEILRFLRVKSKSFGDEKFSSQDLRWGSGILADFLSVKVFFG